MEPSQCDKDFPKSWRERSLLEWLEVKGRTFPSMLDIS